MQHFAGLQLKKITFNTFFQFIVRLISSATTLIVTLLIAYFSGIEMLGSFTKILAFVSIFYLIADFGINPMFLKQHVNDAEKNLGNLLVLRVLLAGCLIPIAVLIALLLPQNSIHSTGFLNIEKLGIFVFSLTILTTAINLSFQSILQKKLTYQLSLLPSLLSSLVLLLFVFIGATRHSLTFFLFAYVLAGAIACVLLWWAIKRRFSLHLKLINFSTFAKTLLIASAPFGLILISNLIYSKIDTFIIALYHSNYDVGIYGISYRFFEFSISVPFFLSASVYPLLLEKLLDKKSYDLLLKKYLQFFLAVSVFSGFLLFLSAPLIQILKSDFRLSIFPLQVLSLSLPFFFLTSLLQWHFLIHKKIKFLLILYFSALLSNIFLNLIFIPKYSYTAAAFTTVFCEGLVFFVMLWYFRQGKDRS